MLISTSFKTCFTYRSTFLTMIGSTTRFVMASLALLLLIGPVVQCEGFWNSHWNLRHVTSRLLQEVQGDRHPNKPPELDTLVENHPNTVMPRNSYIGLEKVCSPDVNGYYGSTMGTPYEIKFGFEAETEPGADLDEVKHAIHESVETILLTTFFPTMCQKGVSTPYESEVTGFHFDADSTQYAQSCKALINDENTCGNYVGTVRVYGDDGNTLAIIRDHLDRDGSENIHQHLRRIFSVSADNGLVAAAAPESVDSGGISSSAIAGLVVGLVTLSVGIVGLAAVQLRRRRSRSARSFHDGASSGAGSDEGELSIETVEHLQPGPTVVIADGRPTSITVEHGIVSYNPELL